MFTTTPAEEIRGKYQFLSNQSPISFTPHPPDMRRRKTKEDFIPIPAKMVKTNKQTNCILLRKGITEKKK